METNIRSFSLEVYLKSHLFIIALLVLSLFAVGLGAFSVLNLESNLPTSNVMSSDPVVLPVDSQTAKRQIAIDVEGQVLHPGIVRIEVDPTAPLRVADVIEKVGGVTTQADADFIAKGINLAAIVTDSMKLYIPKQGEVLGTSVTGTQSTANLINVNSGSLDELERLTGIGQVRAQTIIENRPYSSIEELKAKTKLSTAIEKVKAEISF